MPRMVSFDNQKHPDPTVLTEYPSAVFLTQHDTVHLLVMLSALIKYFQITLYCSPLSLCL